MDLKRCAARTTRERESSMDLKRCAAGKTTEGESSKLMESGSVKRKAESDPAEEMEEGGDKIEDVKEPEVEDPWCSPDPKWGEDSFEGHDYCSSEEEDLFEDNPESERLWRRYKRQLFESKGFYVSRDLFPWYRYSTHRPVYNLEQNWAYGQTYGQYYAEMACLCLQKYNKEKGLSVEFVKVVRGIESRSSISKSYITFIAREEPHGSLVEYQAKVWTGFTRGEYYPILCRPSKSPFKDSEI